MSKKVKIVTVGDGAVGKTCMLISYTTGTFPTEYDPTLYDKFTMEVMVDDSLCQLTLWDTAGQEELKRLRPLCYPETDVFIVCYSITSPVSLENLATNWIPEIKEYCHGTPFIMVGTKADLRTDKVEQEAMRARGEELTFVDRADANQVGETIKASGIFECSAKTHAGVKHVFKNAIKVALADRERQPRPSCLIL